MNKAGGIIGIVSGIFGTIAAVVTLSVGGIGFAFEAEGAKTIVYLGWGGVLFSFLAIVFGAIAIDRPKGAGIGLIIVSIIGAILGGTLVAICMTLSLIGGILAVAGAKKIEPSPLVDDTAVSTGKAMLRKFFTSFSLRNLMFVLLLTGIAISAGYLISLHPLQRDITFNSSNSLEPASVEVLSQLSGPVNITVYATMKDVRLGDIRKIIRDFLSLYQRYKPDIRLEFIDPEKEPEKTRAARIQLNGEMIVEYNGRSEHLTVINEQTLTSTLLRLAHTIDQTVMYLDGHGERKLDGRANHDLGLLFGAKLKQNGFKINSLNLSIAQDVPSNIRVLVISQPQVDLMPGEVDKLLRYIERGGNLLWLIDPGPLHGLERLAQALHLQLSSGVVIDPAASEMNAPASWSLGTSYLPHPVTRNFNLITAYPGARPIAWNEASGWHALMEVAARGWIDHSANPLDENHLSVHPFDTQRDSKGPVVIAAALQRNINDIEQRIVVVGNGAFLSNSFAGNGGNVDLGVNMVNWLASDEKLITLQPRAVKDSSIVLSKTQLTVISAGFLLGLPLLLTGLGGYIWWKRRRA